jgi:hypothetical protein
VGARAAHHPDLVARPPSSLARPHASAGFWYCAAVPPLTHALSRSVLSPRAGLADLHRRAIALGCLAALAAGCGAGPNPSTANDLGVLRVAINEVPGDVLCVQITVSDGLHTVVRKLDAAPGMNVSTTQSGLPIGPVSIAVDAFNAACTSVGSASTPTWVSGVLMTSLPAGMVAMMTVQMARPGTLELGIAFPSDGGIAPLLVSPQTRDYGMVAVGAQSPALIFTVTNPAGNPPTGPLNVLTNGTDPAQFGIPFSGGDSCAMISLAPGASCTTSFFFKPTSTGAKSATLVVKDATRSGQSLLTGTGVAPAAIANLVVNDTTAGGDAIPNNTQWSIQSGFQTGLQPFGDRMFTVELVGSNDLVGKPWLRTAADSKTFTGEPLATFTLTGTSVYLLVDDRHNVGTRPPWLTDTTWVDQGFDVVVRQTPSVTFAYSVWRKSFPSGSIVSLPHVGSNAAPGYIVVVQ